MASLRAGTDLLTAKSGKVRTARRLLRRPGREETGLFLAEGPQAVREALSLPGCVREVFATPDSTPELGDRAAASGVPWHHVDERALESLTETVTPQGVVAVCAHLDVPLHQVLAPHPRLVVACADVRDPGNAGAVIRCADAVAAGGVALLGHSVDPYNGKVVRASAGSLFHLPIAVGADVEAGVAALRAAGLTVLAADGGGEVDLDEAGDDGLLAEPTAWLFGNEAWGLPDGVAALADHRVRIPIHGRAESLNLATAAAVCLYASARAHRPRP
jgi:TrmH family RNA methyltransferase